MLRSLHPCQGRRLQADAAKRDARPGDQSHPTTQPRGAFTGMLENIENSKKIPPAGPCAGASGAHAAPRGSSGRWGCGDRLLLWFSVVFYKRGAQPPRAASVQQRAPPRSPRGLAKPLRSPRGGRSGGSGRVAVRPGLRPVLAQEGRERRAATRPRPGGRGLGPGRLRRGVFKRLGPRRADRAAARRLRGGWAGAFARPARGASRARHERRGAPGVARAREREHIV
jgi:hypothetical protein